MAAHIFQAVVVNSQGPQMLEGDAAAAAGFQGDAAAAAGFQGDAAAAAGFQGDAAAAAGFQGDAAAAAGFQGDAAAAAGFQGDAAAAAGFQGDAAAAAGFQGDAAAAAGFQGDAAAGFQGDAAEIAATTQEAGRMDSGQLFPQRVEPCLPEPRQDDTVRSGTSMYLAETSASSLHAEPSSLHKERDLSPPLPLLPSYPSPDPWSFPRMRLY
ncbi:hypothetical protein SKAU_G00223090 [Synaphobranchus kaupii]|uniref:Uncharacterized protein n=1 Tax=Synaphobranchus kaupii TaxID=118154 RepID=A0A9Q1FBC5_SYNKA|nr:hypothetical protein SKAU_G00223090 [Synaphobranchus kaupii]